MQATLVWDASTLADVGQVVRGAARGGKTRDMMSTASVVDFCSGSMRTLTASETKSDLGLLIYLL